MRGCRRARRPDPVTQLLAAGKPLDIPFRCSRRIPCNRFGRAFHKIFVLQFRRAGQSSPSWPKVGVWPAISLASDKTMDNYFERKDRATSIWLKLPVANPVIVPNGQTAVVDRDHGFDAKGKLCINPFSNRELKRLGIESRLA